MWNANLLSNVEQTNENTIQNLVENACRNVYYLHHSDYELEQSSSMVFVETITILQLHSANAYGHFSHKSNIVASLQTSSVLTGYLCFIDAAFCSR